MQLPPACSGCSRKTPDWSLTDWLGLCVRRISVADRPSSAWSCSSRWYLCRHGLWSLSPSPLRSRRRPTSSWIEHGPRCTRLHGRLDRSHLACFLWSWKYAGASRLACQINWQLLPQENPHPRQSLRSNPYSSPHISLLWFQVCMVGSFWWTVEATIRGRMLRLTLLSAFSGK